MFPILPRDKKISIFLVLLSLLPLPIASSQEADVLIRALKKEDPDTLGYQIVLKMCSSLSYPRSEDYTAAEVAAIIEGEFQLARITPRPNTSFELHLKVEIICFLSRGIRVPYARVAFAFSWFDGTPLAYDWDFFPLDSYGKDFFSYVELAVDDALRAYVIGKTSLTDVCVSPLPTRRSYQQQIFLIAAPI